MLLMLRVVTVTVMVVMTMIILLFQMWLALASLCVLGPDHVERLSSGEWVSSPDSAHGKPRVRKAVSFAHYEVHELKVNIFLFVLVQ